MTRKFTVSGSDIGEEGGTYKGESSYAAAKKAGSQLLRKNNNKKVKFILREKTQGSDKKSYFYEASVEMLDKPIVIDSWKKANGESVTITKKTKLRTCAPHEMSTVKSSKSK